MLITQYSQAALCYLVFIHPLLKKFVPKEEFQPIVVEISLQLFIVQQILIKIQTF